MLARFDERRTVARAPVAGDAAAFVGADRFLVRLVDVSPTGIAVESTREPPQGFVRLQFRTHEHSSLFDVHGLVVRNEERDGKYRWAIRLASPSPGTKKRLNDYVVAAAS